MFAPIVVPMVFTWMRMLTPA